MVDVLSFNARQLQALPAASLDLPLADGLISLLPPGLDVKLQLTLQVTRRSCIRMLDLQGELQLRLEPSPGRIQIWLVEQGQQQSGDGGPSRELPRQQPWRLPHRPLNWRLQNVRAIAISLDRQVLKAEAARQQALHQLQTGLDEIAQTDIQETVTLLMQQLADGIRQGMSTPALESLEMALLTLLIHRWNRETRHLPTHTRLVRLAEEWLWDHLGETVSWADLHRAIATSPRSLQRAFRSEYQISPRQWLRQQRLLQLRLSLLNPEVSQQFGVDALIQQCGLPTSPSTRRAYRLCYGETPFRSWQRSQAKRS